MTVNYYNRYHGLINRLVPDVIIEYYTSTISDDGFGRTLKTYTKNESINKASVQLVDRQKLQSIKNYDATATYRAFWVNGYPEGLNRNSNDQHAPDYILYNNLRYYVIEIVNNYKTGWSMIVGVERPNTEDYQ